MTHRIRNWHQQQRARQAAHAARIRKQQQKQWLKRAKILLDKVRKYRSRKFF